jgi:hypothetical protein
MQTRKHFIHEYVPIIVYNLEVETFYGKLIHRLHIFNLRGVFQNRVYRTDGEIK